MNLSGEYESDIRSHVYNGEPELYFRSQYLVFTTDYNLDNYDCWLDYLIGKYQMYKTYNFNNKESEIAAIKDGLEGLINGL